MATRSDYLVDAAFELFPADPIFSRKFASGLSRKPGAIMLDVSKLLPVPEWNYDCPCVDVQGFGISGAKPRDLGGAGGKGGSGAFLI